MRAATSNQISRDELLDVVLDQHLWTVDQHQNDRLPIRSDENFSFGKKRVSLFQHHRTFGWRRRGLIWRMTPFCSLFGRPETGSGSLSLCANQKARDWRLDKQTLDGKQNNVHHTDSFVLIAHWSKQSSSCLCVQWQAAFFLVSFHHSTHRINR